MRVFVISLLGAAAICFAAWSEGDLGIDRMYDDLSNFVLTSNLTSDCYAACLKDTECVGWVVTPSGRCGGVNATCYLKSGPGTLTQNDCRISGFTAAALQPPTYISPPVGSVTATPGSWLENELTIMGEGLTGYLSKFWADIQNSTWIGGQDDGGLHERTPYWLNGLVPLSYQTGSPSLIAQRVAYLSTIKSLQSPSGWLGPDDMPTDGNQYWSRFNILLSLIQDYEGSGDATSIATIFNYLGEARTRMWALPMGGWAVVRAGDFIMALFWLIDNFATLPPAAIPAGYNEAFLINLADLSKAQMLANGADWKSYFDSPAFPEGAVAPADCTMLTHGVNIGQALKTEALWYRRSQDLTDVASSYIRTEKLDKYHGAPTYIYQGDEHLAGKVSNHGTETCAVTEAIVSYCVEGEVLGDPFFYERAEMIAYNAMPASVTKTQWERVYLQSSNQYLAENMNPYPWITDGSDAGTFSLMGNYGCCTANMHAGLPKHIQRAIASTWARDKIAITMYAPVSTTLPGLGAVAITTDYPFGDSASIVVTPTSSTPVPVLLRIPSWAVAATLSINGGPAVPVGASNGSFFATSTPASASPATFLLAFNPAIRLEPYANGTVSVYRGALLYALWIGQNISVTAQYAYNSQDLAVSATMPWNIALAIKDPSNPAADLTFQQISPPSAVPWNSTDIPVVITGYGRIVEGWTSSQNSPGIPPSSPACAANSSACGAPTPITLVPFGSTHVRMAVMPLA